MSRPRGDYRPLARLRRALNAFGLVATTTLALLSLPVQAAVVGMIITNTASLEYADGDATATVDVRVAGLAPVTINLADLRVPENGGEVIGFLATTGIPANTPITVSDNRFVVSDGALRRRADQAINFEALCDNGLPVCKLPLTFTVTLPGGIFSIGVELELIDVNEPPTDLAIDNNFVAPDSAGGVVGALSFADEDQGDTHTFEVLNDDRFVVVSGQLRLAPGVSLPEDTDINVTVIVTDSGGLTTSLIVPVTTNPANVNVNPSPSAVRFLQPSEAGSEETFGSPLCEGPATVPATAGFGPVTLPGTLKVNDADAYAIGDTLLLQLTDADQNLDPLLVDTVEVLVTMDASGDAEQVTLVESGEDTGEFLGALVTTSVPGNLNDCALTLVADAPVRVSYQDPNDNEDASSDEADIAPIGRVFNALTGDLLDGIILALVNVDSGAVVEVRGDGPDYATFPSAIVSGETNHDALGNAYPAGPGEYRFPAVPNGRYRIELFSDVAWRFSTIDDADLPASIDRLTIAGGSRGEAFVVNQGALPRLDIPLEPVVPDVVMEPTPSTIEFLQYSANPAVGEPVNVQQTVCIAGESRTVSELRGVPVPVPGTVNLVPTLAIKAGQPIFVRVTDLDQNRDPTKREKITVQLDVPATGDREFLELTETTPDSGQFVGYVQSSEDEGAVGSCELGVAKNESIQTRYTDAFDQTDVADSLILVDPFGVLFNTTTGEPIDGITVTLIDTATGQPADVFGDGPFFAPYPNTLVSGGGATDEAGLEYDFPPGEYRFPFVAPGFYRIELSNVPDGYILPSTATVDAIQALPGAPFQVTDGSRLETFEVPVGPALHIDIPIDVPNNRVVLTKAVSQSVASIGDFLQFKISLSNEDGGDLRGATLVDQLPPGLRYQAGSFNINGEPATDPLQSGDGATLTRALPVIPGGQNITVSYVTEVSAGTPLGEIRNTVTAIGDTIVDANVAEARIIITEELLRSKAIITGRVLYGECDDPEAVGLPDALIYMEDGIGVLSDLDGRWHIEDVEPGTHVIQLDEASLPDRYQVADCNSAENRASGRSFSQFVDVRGGSLWNVDYHVVDRPPPEGEVTLQQSIIASGDGAAVTLNADVPEHVDIREASIFYKPPKGWQIEPGSAQIDGIAVSPETTIVGHRFRLPAAGESALTLNIVPKAPATTSAPETSAREVTLRPVFGTREAGLAPDEILRIMANLLPFKSHEIERVIVTGHSDAVPIAAVNRAEFANNYELSWARADSVARVAAEVLDLPPGKLDVQGLGPDQPVASNSSASGREQNRRVELKIISRANAPVVEGATPVLFASDKPLASKANIRFKSSGTPKGKTERSELDLRELGGERALASVVAGTATGSWDAPGDNEATASGEIDINQPPGIISLTEGELISNDIAGVRVKLPSGLLPVLEVNGQEISREKIGITIENSDGTTVYTYVGVDFGKDPGERQVVLHGRDKFGADKFSDSRNVVRVGRIAFIRLSEMPGNVADGKTPVQIRVELLDANLRPVKTTAQLEVVEGRLLPYTSEEEMRQGTVRINRVDVSSHGIVKFRPVSRAGHYRIVLGFENHRDELSFQIAPETREWIMVGLGEGVAGYQDVTGNMAALDARQLDDSFYQDGRLAFFAKGTVKGEWLTTLSYDSDRQTGPLFQRINAAQYYTLYGDSSAQRSDAPTQEKLYVRVENDQLNATYGDYSTELSRLELAEYNRRMSGLRVEYVGETFSGTAFAAETTQAFIRDDIQGNGTSGIYRLSEGGIIQASEQIAIEVRDRYQNQVILETRPMHRDFDYNIDYERGELIFKSPIFSQDIDGNPVFIVSRYEIDTDGRERLNAGGRLVMAFAAGKGLLGTTIVNEEAQGREGELRGVDLTYNFTENTELVAEYARTKQESLDDSRDGDAYKVTLQHQSERLDSNVYIREQEAGFGLGQQNSVGSGTRIIGADATLKLNEAVSVSAQGFTDQNLASGRKRQVVATDADFQTDALNYGVGARAARDSGGGVDTQETQQLTGHIQTHLMDRRLRMRTTAEVPISGDNEAFPLRMLVGADYDVTDRVTVTGQQEFTWSDLQNTQRSTGGVRSRLWEGLDVNTSLVNERSVEGQRLLANYGLIQNLRAGNWSFDFGVDRAQTITAAGQPVDDNINPGAVPVFGGADGDFTALFAGANYSAGAWQTVSRIEQRLGVTEDQLNINLGAMRNLENGIVLASVLDIRTLDGPNEKLTDNLLNIGFAYRPDDSNWRILNRLDLSVREQQGGGFDTRTRKIVNNLNANYQWDPQTQVSLQYAFKYVLSTIDNIEYSGFTDLIGTEVRRNLNDRWDLGLHASMLHSWNSDAMDAAYGLSVGYQVMNNSWVSVGYNFEGFRDSDFDEADYTAKGVYLKFRFKFDQDTAKALLKEHNVFEARE